jgi:hypothetical protein
MATDTKNYTPTTEHGELTKILDDVYVVRGSFYLGLGAMISRTMTIVKRGNDLTVINAVRVSEEAEAEIKKLGTVKNLVRMSEGHGCDDAYYLNTFKPTYWSVKSFKPIAHGPPPDYTKALEEVGEVPIPDMKVILFKNAAESVLWLPDGGGTVIACDLIQNNIETPPHTNWLGKQATYWMGFQGECKCVPIWRLINGTDQWEDCERVLAWEFNNLVSGHGEAKIGDAKAICERNLKETFKKK